MSGSDAVLRVLILEESGTFRYHLQKELSARGFGVFSVAAEPAVAIHRIHRENPHVILLDAKAGTMNVPLFVERLMRYHPLPVVVIGTDDQLMEKTFLDLGVCACFRGLAAEGVPSVPLDSLAEALRNAASQKESLEERRPRPFLSVDREVLLFDVVPPKAQQKEPVSCDRLIAIGSSTGGTNVVEKILASLNPSSPPVVIVQHMPENFTPLFADRLNRVTSLYVKEAVDGDPLYRGYAVIAPGNHHLVVDRCPGGYTVRITMDPPVNLFRPSVDVLFSSVARAAGARTTAVLLTGMGGDGARGMMEIQQAGGMTIAQDQSSSAVFGMPREAIRMGAARYVRDIDGIVTLLRQVN